jgi:hypothetical protein
MKLSIYATSRFMEVFPAKAGISRVAPADPRLRGGDEPYSSGMDAEMNSA